MAPILIRSARTDDAADLAAIYAFEEVVAFTSQLPYRDAEFWRDFYKVRDPDGIELVADSDGRVVGHLGLMLNRAPRRKHVATFGICVHPDFHGKGAGSTLIREMIRLCDDWLNITRLELSVASHNGRAIALYERFGFQKEGEARFDLFTGGVYANTTHMARFHPSLSLSRDEVAG